MTKQPEVSVVLPLFNDGLTIGHVLKALYAQSKAPDYEIIVVDDGSTDNGPDRVMESGTRLIRQCNAGPAAARNRGAREAQGRILLFLDSDCVPPENWIAAMSKAIDGYFFHGAMGTLVAANDGVVPRLVQIEVEDRYRGMGKSRHGVDFLAAPSCGFVRDVFLKLGGFDERLRQAEDVELAYRFTGAGFRIVFVDSAPVAHSHQTTWREFFRAKYRRATGRLRVFALHPDKRRSDSWTPMTFKAQFAAVATSMPLLFLGLFGLGWVALVGVILLGLGVLLGWPVVVATAQRQRSLLGIVGGVTVGAAFVVIRSLIILMALLTIRLDRLYNLARAIRAGN